MLGNGGHLANIGYLLKASDLGDLGALFCFLTQLNMEATQTSPGKGKKALQGCGACALILLFFAVAGAISRGGSPSPEPTNTADLQGAESPIEDQTKELTTEDQIKEAFIAEFSSTSNTGDERIREVTIWKDDDGTSWVTVDYNADDNLTSNLMRSSMWNDAKAFYKTVTPLLSSDFNGAVLNAWFKTTDAYGTTEDSKVMTVTMERSTWEKITWDNFLHENIPVVADVYFESPIFNN